MTDSSNPKDNSEAERINNTLKNELIKNKEFLEIDEVRDAMRAVVHSRTMSGYCFKKYLVGSTDHRPKARGKHFTVSDSRLRIRIGHTHTPRNALQRTSPRQSFAKYTKLSGAPTIAKSPQKALHRVRFTSTQSNRTQQHATERSVDHFTSPVICKHIVF